MLSMGTPLGLFVFPTINATPFSATRLAMPCVTSAHVFAPGICSIQGDGNHPGDGGGNGKKLDLGNAPDAAAATRGPGLLNGGLDIPRLHAALNINLHDYFLKRLNGAYSNVFTRAFGCLGMQNIQWVGQLVLRTERNLRGVKNMGGKSIEELKSVLAEFSAETGVALSLGMLPEQLHGWRPPQG